GVVIMVYCLFQAEDGIRYSSVTGVQTCALPILFRENTEGMYANIGGQLRRGTSDEIAINEEINTRKGVERIVVAAFEYARRAKKIGRASCRERVEGWGGAGCRERKRTRQEQRRV